MYDLPYFKEQDAKVVMDFIHANPFAFICGCDENDHPVATQIPVFIEERNGRLYLTGHMMRNTDHHKAFEKNNAALCVFTGDHTYVSATWYSDPHQASTWNYMSVHVRGKMKFMDQEGLISILKKTSLHFENNNSSSTTVYDNLSPEYTSKLVKAIVGFEVEVEHIDNVFKLSQNRDEKSFETIIEKLKDGGKDAKTIAEEMQKRQSQLYPSKS
jgi:transcriptional regulator